MSKKTKGLKSLAALAELTGSGEQKREKDRKKVTAEKVHAPYNFVPLGDTIIEIPSNNRVPREEINDAYYSGEFKYTVTARTPIMVSSGKEKDRLAFFRDAKSGQYAIPGSTVRGLIRSNVQILGMADVSDDIDDYRLMFREVGGGRDRILYNELIGLNNMQIVTGVKAGYIENMGNEYRITGVVIDKLDDAHGEMNYYTLSEEDVLRKKSSFPGLFPVSNFPLQNSSIGDKKTKDKKDERYLPYIIPITYDVSADCRVTKVDKEDGTGANKGFAVSTGEMWGSSVKEKRDRNGKIIYEKDDYGSFLLDKNGERIPVLQKRGNKKVIYIFPEEDTKKELGIFADSDPCIKAFQIDYEKKKNGLVSKDRNGNDVAKVCGEYQYTKKEFFALPETGKKRPVFYMEHAGRLYIGFTPRLRLLTERTIHDGIPKKRTEGRIDLAQSIFGYTDENGECSYKSKVSFTNALLMNGKEEQSDVSVVPGEPKPSFYPSYLAGDDDNAPKTYNSDEIRLRGIKQYWIRDSVIRSNIGKNTRVVTSFRPLPKGSVFEGTIRFSNLTEEELGLLLWSIQMDGAQLMNVGYAKPYGYGTVNVSLGKVRTIDPEKAYSLDSFCMEPYRDEGEEIKPDEFIRRYREYLEKKAGRKIRRINDFFYMKDSEIRPTEADMAYMELKEHSEGNVRNRETLPVPGKLIHKAKRSKE